MIGLGTFLLLILAMMVFTNLGARPQPPAPVRDHSRVHDIYIQRPVARDAGR